MVQGTGGDKRAVLRSKFSAVRAPLVCSAMPSSVAPVAPSLFTAAMGGGSEWADSEDNGWSMTVTKSVQAHSSIKM